MSKWITKSGDPGMHAPVFIVETDPLCLSALSFLLESAGFRPFPFSSAQAACAALGEQGDAPVALITELDLNAACQACCIVDEARRRFPGVVVIVLTADTSMTARGTLEALDCHVLFKPSRPEDILALLPPMEEGPRPAGPSHRHIGA